MKPFNKYLLEWKASSKSFDSIKKDEIKYFIYSLNKKQRIRIFGESWNLLDEYKDKVYINGEKCVFDTHSRKHGFTKDMYDPGEYKVYIEDIDDVTDCYSMFSECTQLISVPLFDISKSNTMASMFSYCTNLQFVPKFNTKNIEEITSAFKECKKLKDVPLFDLPKVKPYSFGTFSCFYGCKKLSKETKQQWSKMYDFGNTVIN